VVICRARETGSITPGRVFRPQRPEKPATTDRPQHSLCMRIGRRLSELSLLRRGRVLDFMTGRVSPNSFVCLKPTCRRVFPPPLIAHPRTDSCAEQVGASGGGWRTVVARMRKILIDVANATPRARTFGEINDGIFRSVMFNDDQATFWSEPAFPLWTIIKGEGRTS